MTSADGTTATRRPIVAGVDGSESSLAALRWAMRQAELTGAPLEIVSAWEWPVSWGWQAPIPPGYDPADEARRQLDKAISAVLTPGDAIEARRTVIEGNPAPVLEALSKTADLIVIGSHGHGEFAGMLLGSVSQHCITHCHCPVVVIRGTGRRARPDDEADSSSPSSSSSRDTRVNARSVLERLDEAESMELLANGGVGRLVFTSRYGPTALPVAYKIDGGSLILGTWNPVFDEELRTGIAHADYHVAVEADQIDLQAREGWVVLVPGAAHHLDTEAERAPIIDAGLQPWVEGVAAHFIRVNPTSVQGARARRA